MGNRYFHIKSPVLVFVFELFQEKSILSYIMAHLDNINWFQLCIFALLIIEKHIKQLYYESKTFSFGFGFVALDGSFGGSDLPGTCFREK